MQRVGFQRLAGRFFGDFVERSGTEEVNDDRHHHHGKGRKRRFDRVVSVE